MGRGWAKLQPVSLLAPTQANGPIVLCGRAEALVWGLLGSCPEGHPGRPSLFPWSQSGSSVTRAEGSGHSRGYLVLAFPTGSSGCGCPQEAL